MKGVKRRRRRKKKDTAKAVFAAVNAGGLAIAAAVILASIFDAAEAPQDIQVIALLTIFVIGGIAAWKAIETFT